MLAIHLDTDTETRLDDLVRKTGCSKTFFAREAILSHLDDLEDIYLATQRLSEPAPTHSSEEVRRALDL